MKNITVKMILWLCIAALLLSAGCAFLFSAAFLETIGNSFIRYLIQNLVLTVLLVFVAALVMTLIIASPLRKLSETLKTMASGGSDFTRHVEWNSHDEVRELFDNFNTLMAKLGNMITSLQDMVDRSTEIGENVESATKKTAALSQDVSSSIQKNKEMISSLNTEIETSMDGIKNVRKQIHDLVELIMENQAASINQSTAAIEEMIASVSNISKIALSKKELTDKLIELTHTGSQDMKRTIETINDVAKSATGIMDMIAVINDVAERINLLAMNAAIEAAHAAEAGKGFAVVANEVKKLAETTNANVKNISQSLSTMMKHMEQTTAVTKQTDESIRRIAETIGSVTDGMTEIANSVTEVSAGGDEIMKSLQILEEITQKVKNSSADTDANMDSVNASIDNISALSDKNLKNAEQMENLVQEISNSIDGLLEQGKHNAEQIAGIDAEISKFKTRKGESTFILGYNEVPPFSMSGKNGAASGAANEFFRAVAEEMGIKRIQYRHIQSLERIYEMLDRNMIDAYTLATRTYEPNPKLKYVVPAKPSITPPAGFVMLKTHPLNRISSAAELKGLRIGTKNGMPLTATLSHAGADIQYFGGEEPLMDCIRMMMKNRLDAVYSIIVTELQYMSKLLGVQDHIKTVLLPDPLLEIFTAFSARTAEKILDAYNKAQDTVSARTPFDTFLQQYLK